LKNYLEAEFEKMRFDDDGEGSYEGSDMEEEEKYDG